MIWATRIRTDLWREMDEAKLSPAARVLLVHLLSSPSQTPPGVTAVTPERWARLVGHPVDAIETALDELEHVDAIVVDRELGEVLVRTFWRYNAPELGNGAGIRHHLTHVVSGKIRDAAIGR